MSKDLGGLASNPSVRRTISKYPWPPRPLNMYRRGADYADNILRGVKPADIPIEQPTNFEPSASRCRRLRSPAPTRRLNEGAACCGAACCAA
jgi:hypothetical protein